MTTPTTQTKSISRSELLKRLREQHTETVRRTQALLKEQKRVQKEICQVMRREFKVDEVALSGGVWQNITLLKKTIHLLEGSEFAVYSHRQVPANDGGLALGQAVITIQTL